MSKTILNENTYTIHGWMINELKLKGVALNVYAIIYGFSQDGESEFYGSRQYLASFVGVSKPTIDKALNGLVNKGYIIKNSEKKNEITFNRYKANLNCLNFDTDKETLQGGVKKLYRGGDKETLHNNKDILDKYKDIYIDIVGFLNKKAGTEYRPSTPKTQSLIKLRMNEGFSTEDFKKVIENMCYEWKGNEKMERYLRPETLFGTKFESYLNRNIKKTVGNSGMTKDEIDEIEKRYEV